MLQEHSEDVGNGFVFAWWELTGEQEEDATFDSQRTRGVSTVEWGVFEVVDGSLRDVQGYVDLSVYILAYDMMAVPVSYRDNDIKETTMQSAVTL
ncbi:hypothetical protein M405DRAFT_826586 [Rhizopogon salebrosus TDB-379]|nr:hypothetical protein M405DRAFT_826586 [Rhizopogon salebrosus TDB-379]